MKINTLEVTEQPEGLGFASMRKLVNQTLNKDFGTMLRPGAIPTGFSALDKCLGGLQKGQLYTVAVKPGMGKTAFLLSIANNMAIKDDYAVAIFSAERSNIKMTKRIIESETGMSLDKLQSGTFKESESDHIQSLLSYIAKAKIFIDDTTSISVDDLVSKAIQLKDAFSADIIIVDYLELIDAAEKGSAERPGQLAEILERLRNLAVEHNIPVLVFSQSASMINGHGYPKDPSALGLPGFLQKASDVLMLLHRNDAFPVQVGSGKSAVELKIIKKVTPEEEYIVPLHFIGSIEKFADHVQH